MADQTESKGKFIPVLVAIITGITSIVSTYIATQKSNQNIVLKDEVIDYRKELARTIQRHDSLSSAYNNLSNSYNELVKRYKNDVPTTQGENTPVTVPDVITTVTSPNEDDSENIFPLPTIAQGRERYHYVVIKKVMGDKKNKQVTIKFLSTNERFEGHEQLHMYESIGTFQGTTYYAIRGRLGDKIGEGQDQSTNPGMQVVKGEPTSASIVMNDVSSTVNEFSRLIIHINGDHVSFKNIPIVWK